MKITFNFLNNITLSKRKELKNFLKHLVHNEKTNIISINLIFCTDDYLIKINKQFLGHNTFTDIITFNLGSETLIEGEIYISTDRIKENSKLFKTTINNELHRVIFHGVLHLCSYNDKKPSEKKQMTEKENIYIKKYFK